MIYSTNHYNKCPHLQADLADIEDSVGHYTQALERLKSTITEAKTQKASTLPLIGLFCAGAIIKEDREESLLTSEWSYKAVESSK